MVWHGDVPSLGHAERVGRMCKHTSISIPNASRVLCVILIDFIYAFLTNVHTPMHRTGGGAAHLAWTRRVDGQNPTPNGCIGEFIFGPIVPLSHPPFAWFSPPRKKKNPKSVT